MLIDVHMTASLLATSSCSPCHDQLLQAKFADLAQSDLMITVLIRARVTVIASVMEAADLGSSIRACHRGRRASEDILSGMS